MANPASICCPPGKIGCVGPSGEASCCDPAVPISYQGQVAVSGTPYHGTGYFKFAVVDQAGTTTYWSNDGASSGGAEPTNAVALSVTNGLFEILLGDTSLTNMSQKLTSSVFEDTNRNLRVWFSESGGAGTFTQLSPDQRVAAVPYTLQAEEAKTTGDADALDGLEGSAYQQRVSETCATGSAIRVISSDGTVTCQEDDENAYSAGNQLNLNGTEFAVLEGSDSGLDADRLDGQQGGAYQNRVTVACATGSAIREIASDGSVTCANSIRPGFTLTTVDSGGAYASSSITIGSDGLGLISYYDWSSDDLKVAHCNDIACSNATITTLDSGGDVGDHTSITIGADGLGLISYFHKGTHPDIWNRGDLKVAHCNNVNCSSATYSTLDSAEAVGWFTSITIGADGLGLISYYDNSYNDLKVAHCNDTACSGATTYRLDSGGNVGVYTSITIGADGLGLISYYDYTTNTALKVAHCSNVNCSSATRSTLDSDLGPLLGQSYTSITIGADGLGLISYYDNNNDDLKVAHCNNTACTSAATTTLDSAGGLCTSITIGADGLGLISYSAGYPNWDLKVAHLSNVFGVPYWRRR